MLTINNMIRSATAAGVFGTLLAASIAFAQSEPPSTSSGQATIIFPIAELGDCNSKEECKTYCDDSTNAEACLSFAETHGLMLKAEVEKARAFTAQLRRT